MNSPNLIIVDLDGTLADLTDRRHFVESRPKNWDAFYGGMTKDHVNTPVAEVVLQMYKEGYMIIVCTGRPDKYEQDTKGWLYEHNIPFDNLLMRKDGDHRPDFEVKREMLFSFLVECGFNKSDILFALDDRDQVVKMWREESIPCFQVAEGNF